MHAFMCCWRPGGGLPAGAKFERKSHYARRALIGRISDHVLPAGEHLVPVAALEATADRNFPTTNWQELSLEWVAEAVLEIADQSRTVSYERPKVAGHGHRGLLSEGSLRKRRPPFERSSLPSSINPSFVSRRPLRSTKPTQPAEPELRPRPSERAGPKTS
jgi:hypothetical protein